MIHHGLTEWALSDPDKPRTFNKCGNLQFGEIVILTKYDQEVVEARQTIQSNVKIELTDPVAFKTI